MKKSMLVFCMLAFFGIAACTNSDNKSDNNSETNSQPQPEPQPQPEKPQNTSTPAETSKQKDGTTIKVNNDGVSVESKDGEKKSNVSISGDSTKIEISRPKK